MAGAQTPLPTPATPPVSPDFMTRYNFHLSADQLSIDDPRFSWQVHFGGDLDVVDYVGGRVNVLLDYEAVLGDQLRAFDPNQGNYILETSASVRLGGTEVAGLFHHESRHLSDRPKDFAIAWNVLGVRVFRQLAAAGTTVDLQGSYARVTERAYVDYAWTGDADVMVRRPLNTRVGVFAHGYGQLIGIDPTASFRDMQQGGRVEGGVRLGGLAGSAELFVGLERRIDADPIDGQSHRWVLIGFRLVRQ